MKTRRNTFNTYLLAALCAAWLGGCASPPRSKDAPVVRVYLEMPPDGTGNQETIPIGRRPLFEVSVMKEPFLTEFHVKRAEVRDDKLGGIEMVMEFNRQGRWLLDEASTLNKGRRAVIFVKFDQIAHWTAAPVMKNRITDGTLTFTPNLTRAEAETMARRINEEEAKQKIHDY
jgi:hypothetical protein